jgi:hypothetical protein
MGVLINRITSGYLYIQLTMPVDLMGDGSNNFFSLANENTIDSHHNNFKLFSFKGLNYYHQLPELGLTHFY